ncbi:MAG: 1,2-phenylacetyl-CoA epoxidase subunit PaaD [Halobacteriaceae archaeon]
MTTDQRPEDPIYCTHTEYRTGSGVEELPATGEDATGVEARVWDALYGVEDPEMPVSIVDLGLIYGVTVEEGQATVSMTLTYTGCPARDLLLEDVQDAVAGVDGIDRASIELVWNPPWTVDLVTDAGRDALREWGVSV